MASSELYRILSRSGSYNLRAALGVEAG